MEVLHLPAPAYDGPDACDTCAGRGVVGEPLLLHRAADPLQFAVNALCGTCGGCGRNHLHHGCTAVNHPDWPAPDDDTATGCPQCEGRRWWPLVVFAPHGGLARLRMPCFCARPALVPIHIPDQARTPTHV